MKLFIVYSLVAGAAAFAPASQTASPSTSTPPATAAGPALRMSSYFEDELGAQPPLGFFDPAGFVANGDQDKFDRLRAVELKHGRVSMLAMVGYLVTEAGARLPGTIDLAGTIKFSSIPSGFAALAAVPQSGLVQIAAFVGFLEVAVMRDVTGEGEHIGDFRNGALDFGWYAQVHLAPHSKSSTLTLFFIY